MVAGRLGSVQSPARARLARGRRGGRSAGPGVWRGVARRSFTTRQGGGASGQSPARPKPSAARRNSAQARGARAAWSSPAAASPALTVTLTPAGRTSTHWQSPSSNPTKRSGPGPGAAGSGEMGWSGGGIVAGRRGGAGTDLISQIVNTQPPGEELSDAEIGGFCSLLHDAAQNTTMNMITHGVVTLAHEPDARRRLAAEPGLWPKAVEELLRYVSPVQGLARTTTRPVELHGVTIPEGDQVLVLYGSANHDERVHLDPERFDLDRESTKAHWAFGHGIHYCLGNAVARLEIQTSLQVLVERIGDWDVDDDRIELDQLVPTRGVASAPVSFAPESG